MTTPTQTSFSTHQKTLIAAARTAILVDLADYRRVDRYRLLAYAFLRGKPYWRIEGLTLAPAPEGAPAYTADRTVRRLQDPPGSFRWKTNPLWLPLTRLDPASYTAEALRRDIRRELQDLVKMHPAPEGEPAFEIPSLAEIDAWMREPVPYAEQQRRVEARRAYLDAKRAGTLTHKTRTAA